MFVPVYISISVSASAIQIGSKPRTSGNIFIVSFNENQKMEKKFENEDLSISIESHEELTICWIGLNEGTWKTCVCSS